MYTTVLLPLLKYIHHYCQVNIYSQISNFTEIYVITIYSLSKQLLLFSPIKHKHLGGEYFCCIRCCHGIKHFHCTYVFFLFIFRTNRSCGRYETHVIIISLAKFTHKMPNFRTDGYLCFSYWLNLTISSAVLKRFWIVLLD